LLLQVDDDASQQPPTASKIAFTRPCTVTLQEHKVPTNIVEH
jgi:hypothetical protein